MPLRFRSMIKIDDRVRGGDARGRARDDRGHDPRGEPPLSRSAAADPAVAGGDRGRRAGAGRQARRARTRRAERCRCSCGRRPASTSSSTRTFGRALETALDQARERGLVTGTLTPGDLLRLPQALTIRERQADGRRGGAGERGRAGARGGRPGAGRSRRDARRAKAITCAPTSISGATFVADLVERDRRRRPTKGAPAMEQRLAERVRELRTELQADETAVAQEIVRMAARSDISEEVARFRGHVVALGARWPTAPSRAAASSISCCRR